MVFKKKTERVKVPLNKIAKPTSKPRKVYGACSPKQQIILQDNTTDVILMGGK